MLLFSTCLNISKTMTPEAFIRTVIEWNDESTYEENKVPDIQWSGEKTIRFGNEKVSIDIRECASKNTIAVRHEKKTDAGIIWDTDFIMNFDEMKMSVRLERSFMDDVLYVDPRFSTPHFITLLIRHGFLLADDDLPVGREPIYIDYENVTLLSDVVLEKKYYHYPVVFVSKTVDNTDPVDVKKLAGRLKGVAHVLVQNNTNVGSMIRRECNGLNQYNGAIGVYYPSYGWEPKRFLYREFEGVEESLANAVVKNVIQYSNSLTLDPIYTWAGINSDILLEILDAQKQKTRAAENKIEQAINEADALVESVDEDLNALRERIEELARENAALHSENLGLRAKLKTGKKDPVLNFGDEEEFFTDEIKNMLLLELKDALTNTDPASRRYDVLEDIINSNGGCPTTVKEKSNDLKAKLSGYRNVTDSIKQLLKEIGFEISEDGKHYKLKYYGDDRYTTIMAKTPSDSRTGQNTASDIIRLFL